VRRLGLSALGLPADIEAALRRVIAQPHGLVLVTGPTGSGKTSTLYACLDAINAPDVKILTIEDPVEYEVDGPVQVSVHPPTGLTFARALRSFLRQDPDVILVGEIRDAETAQIAVQAALSGHLVLSTLHTNDAPGAVERLLDLGVEPFLIASTVQAVLAQRLVRRVCAHCRRLGPIDATAIGLLGEDGPGVRGGVAPEPVGCTACHQYAYLGRLALFEWFEISAAARELIGEHAPPDEWRRAARAAGTVPLRQVALRAALAGHTTIEEVLKHT
jgi:type IV pilus assembly protein PilB